MDQPLNDAGEAGEYQQSEWRVQRFGWSVMALFVLAALFGLLGSSGPFAKSYLTAPDGSFEVQHMRLVHHHDPSLLTVTLSPALIENGEMRVWMDAEYVYGLSIQTISPEPESVDVGPDRVVYTFTADKEDGPLTIVFNYEHDGYWWQQAELGVEGGGSVDLRQFVFP